jgi:hypothetical protein
MLATASRRFLVVAGFICLLVAPLSHAADAVAENIQKDLVGSWIVDVDGESRSRTLNIKGAEKKRDGAWVLDSTYGWTDGTQTPVSAELIARPDGYRIHLTTQANSQISADSSGTALFDGTFTPSSGNVRPVTLQRVSDEELRKRTADLTASRIRSAMRQPSADVPARCAGFAGGWTGKWPYYGQSWLWVVDVDANCFAKVAHRSTSEFPGAFSSVQIKEGVLAIRGSQGTNFFELHSDQLWARYAGTDGNNNTLFQKIPLGEK